MSTGDENENHDILAMLMMTMLQKISRPATEECCALCWHPECVLSRRKGREGWPWSLKEEDDDDDDGNDENYGDDEDYVALLLEEPLWSQLFKKMFFSDKETDIL